MTLLLPETRGRPLPQTIEEVENLSRRLPRPEEQELNIVVEDTDENITGPVKC